MHLSNLDPSSSWAWTLSLPSICSWIVGLPHFWHLRPTALLHFLRRCHTQTCTDKRTEDSHAHLPFPVFNSSLEHPKINLVHSPNSLPGVISTSLSIDLVACEAIWRDAAVDLSSGCLTWTLRLMALLEQPWEELD